MRSLPIRLRLTLPFAFTMAAVIAGLAFFVYVKVGGTLIDSVDQRLRGEVADALARGSGDAGLLDLDVRGRDEAAELLDAEGGVLRSRPPGLPAFLRGADLARVLGGKTILRSGNLPGLEDERRLLASPVDRGRARVLVVTASLEPREETLHNLLRGLLLAGPVALLLAALGGYALAAAALRPVEAIRRRAAAISAAAPGRRLPIPAARDEISRLATTLNDMIGRLEASFEHERRFVSDASHELRTPLALLRAELELALRRPRSAEELHAALESAAEETERLTRLAEDLLFIARADQGALPVRPTLLDAAGLLNAAAERVASRARALGRDLVVDVPGGLLLDADEARAEQALGNLLDNALVHGAGTIRLSAEEDGDYARLHVRDEGPGFADGFAERAFDRFTQADEARGAGGSGLGLSIVEAIARAHGGRVGICSGGAGADVWIAFPRSHSPLIASP